MSISNNNNSKIYLMKNKKIKMFKSKGIIILNNKKN